MLYFPNLSGYSNTIMELILFYVNNIKFTISSMNWFLLGFWTNFSWDNCEYRDTARRLHYN